MQLMSHVQNNKNQQVYSCTDRISDFRDKIFLNKIIHVTCVDPGGRLNRLRHRQTVPGHTTCIKHLETWTKRQKLIDYQHSIGRSEGTFEQRVSPLPDPSRRYFTIVSYVVVATTVREFCNISNKYTTTQAPLVSNYGFRQPQETSPGLRL